MTISNDFSSNLKLVFSKILNLYYLFFFISTICVIDGVVKMFTLVLIGVIILIGFIILILLMMLLILLIRLWMWLAIILTYEIFLMTHLGLLVFIEMH